MSPGVAGGPTTASALVRVLAVVQDRGGWSAGMGGHLMPAVEQRALSLASSQAQDGTGEFARALDVLAGHGPAR